MRIEDIDLAAAIVASTGLHPELSKHPQGQLQTFTFPDNDEVITAVTRYVTDDLFLSAKRLLSFRSFLYRQLRERR